MTPLSADDRAELARLESHVRHDIESAARGLTETPVPRSHLDRTESIRVVNHARRLLNALPRLLAQVDGLEARLAGMTGERDAEREIAQGWERKASDLEAEVERMRLACEIAGRWMVDDVSREGMDAYARFLGALAKEKP